MRSITRWPASRGQSAGFCLTIVDIKKNEHKNMVTQISLEGWVDWKCPPLSISWPSLPLGFLVREGSPLLTKTTHIWNDDSSNNSLHLAPLKSTKVPRLFLEIHDFKKRRIGWHKSLHLELLGSKGQFCSTKFFMNDGFAVKANNMLLKIAD